MADLSLESSYLLKKFEGRVRLILWCRCTLKTRSAVIVRTSLLVSYNLWSAFTYPVSPGITPLAQKHLLEMGVLQEILKEHKGRWLKRGGFVSPSAHSFVSDFSADRELCVQRVLLDAHMARAAERAGYVDTLILRIISKLTVATAHRSCSSSLYLMRNERAHSGR